MCCCSITTDAKLDQVSLSFSTTNYTAIVPQSHEEFIAISENEAIVTSKDTLYLLQNKGNTSRIIAKQSLQSQLARELYALVLEDDIYVVVNYDGKSVHVHKYSHSASNDGLKHWRSYHLKLHHVPTSRLIVSIHVRDGRLNINVAHVIEDKLIRLHDLNHKRNRGIVELPPGCICNNLNCLKTVYNSQGQLIVDCASGSRYLCNTYEEEFFPLPSSVHRVVTSKVDRFLAVAIMPMEDLNQDLLLILRFSDNGGDSTLITVAIAQPERIFDLDVVRMNGTDQELVFCVSNTTLHYFMLKDNDTSPDTQSLPIPSNVIISGIRAATDSLLAVVLEYENDTIAAFIDANVIEQENVTFANETESSNDTIATSFNETFTSTSNINITMSSTVSSTCKPSEQLTQTVTKYVTVTTSVVMPIPSTSTPGINTTVTSPNNSSKPVHENQKVIILLLLILVVLIVIFVFIILIAFYKTCQHH